MIPQPIVSRSVSCAISAETTVDERASMPCLRHHGYASASQIVSSPASSITRAEASISSSGSIVSCMTPIRKAGTEGSSQSRRRAVSPSVAQPHDRVDLDVEPVKSDWIVVRAGSGSSKNSSYAAFISAKWSRLLR